MNPNVEKMIFALGACVFAAIALIAVILTGDSTARNFAAWSAFFACWSQFIAQDRNPIFQRLSIVTAYVAFALMFLALVFLTKG